MKMKKLTALALAGVLCLGMSTTAFAVDSPNQGTAEENKDSVVATEGVKGDKVDTTKPGNEVFKNWEKDAANDKLTPEKRSDKIVKSFENELKSVNDILNDEDKVDTLTTKQYAQLQEKQAVLEELADPDALYELVTLEDLKVEPGTDAPTADDPITVRFDLNNKFEDIEEGQTIRILHLSEDGAVWEVYETVVQHDMGGYYAEWDFEHFSPVAVMRVTETGTNTDPIDPEDPTDPTEPTDPVVPSDPSINNGANANGSITADQLADLIVKKLQQNANAATKAVVRTSGKASPKTGE